MDSASLFCGFFLPCYPNGLSMVERPPPPMARFAFTLCQQLLAVHARQCEMSEWQCIRFSLRFNSGEKSKGTESPSQKTALDLLLHRARMISKERGVPTP